MNDNETTNIVSEDDLVKFYEGGDLKEIYTAKGIMPKSELDRKVVPFEDDNELTYAIEYCLKGTDEIVRRSVHVQLKKNVVAESAAAEF